VGLIPQKILNKTILDTTTPENANLLFNNNQVINGKKMKIIKEELILKCVEEKYVYEF